MSRIPAVPTLYRLLAVGFQGMPCIIRLLGEVLFCQQPYALTYWAPCLTDSYRETLPADPHRVSREHW